MARRKKKIKVYQNEAKTIAKERYTFEDEPQINVKPRYEKAPNPYRA